MRKRYKVKPTGEELDSLLMSHCSQFIDKSGDCWEWKGSKNGSGYGIFGLAGKAFLSHRVLWALHNGGMSQLKKGYMICHKCNNPGCCNPEHLYQGTSFDNHKDRVKAGTVKVGIVGNTHGCGRGTNLKSEDVYWIRENVKTLDNKSMALAMIRFDITQVVVRDIVLRKSFKHLE